MMPPGLVFTGINKGILGKGDFYLAQMESSWAQAPPKK